MLRFEGTLKSWNDDKGFGFISPSQGGQDIFVHISEYRPGGRPVLNEALSFEVALDPQGKKRAVNVQRAGAQQAVYPPASSRRPVRVSRSGNPASGLKTGVALLLVAALGWQGYAYYQKNAAVARANAQAEAAAEAPDATPVRPVAEPVAPTPPTPQPTRTLSLDLTPSRTGATSFRCDGRKHCSQMTSCEEATYFLKNCPGTKMDGDGDGVPCEQQLCR